LPAIKLATLTAPAEYITNTDLPTMAAPFWFKLKKPYHYTVNYVGNLNIIHPSRRLSVDVAKKNKSF
jgi:hypothetical protein